MCNVLLIGVDTYVQCLAYVLLICLAYMSCLYVLLICLAYMSCLYVLLICRAHGCGHISVMSCAPFICTHMRTHTCKVSGKTVDGVGGWKVKLRRSRGA
jgi:hypothetical protein